MTQVEALLIAYPNPLHFDPKKGDQSDGSLATALLEFLLLGHSPAEFSELIEKRRTRLASVADRLLVLPADQRIADKLVAPLRHAYASFLVGNFLGTLSLCGLICEMLAIFRFEISEFQINGRSMAPEDQTALFGDIFEKLGQDRRIKVLRSYGVVDLAGAADLEKVRKIRNRYLHYFSLCSGATPRVSTTHASRCRAKRRMFARKK